MESVLGESTRVVGTLKADVDALTQDLTIRARQAVDLACAVYELAAELDLA
jgi:hypothetical protein